MALGQIRVRLCREKGKGSNVDRTKFVLRWYRQDGSRGAKSLGFVSEIIAQRLKSEWEHTINIDGEPMDQEQTDRQRGWQWGEFGTTYNECKRSEVSSQHLADIKSSLTRFGQQSGCKNVQDVKTSHCRGWYQSRLGSVSRRTANRDLINLRAAFSWAIEQQAITINPTDGIRMVKPEPVDPHVLDAKTINLTIEHAVRWERDSNVDGNEIEWRLYFNILATCGLRRSEGMRLRRQDVRMRDGKPSALFIWQTKSNRSRTVPAGEGLGLMIAKWMMQTHGNPDSPLMPYVASTTPQSVSRKWREASVKANHPSKLHDLRRTYGTSLAASATTPYILMRLMGHSSINTTMGYYVSVSDDSLQNTIPTYAAAIA